MKRKENTGVKDMMGEKTNKHSDKFSTNLLNVELELFPDTHLFFPGYVLGLILPSQHKLRLVQLPKNEKRMQRNSKDAS
jgi:hypothetical protein